jgi:UDP-GlcNAc3NAcA epimerase
MYDASLFYRDRAREMSDILDRLDLEAGKFALATCHRAENTDDPIRLREICLGLADTATSLPVVFPMHPRTRKVIEGNAFQEILAQCKVIDPVPFLDMVALEQAAKVILTDSGGVQKEAFFYGVPCMTMRDETEWTETVDLGRNVLCGASREKIRSAGSNHALAKEAGDGCPYGDGRAANYIGSILIDQSSD